MRAAIWLVRQRRAYSCGTAQDLHLLPPEALAGALILYEVGVMVALSKLVIKRKGREGAQILDRDPLDLSPSKDERMVHVLTMSGEPS